MVTRVLSRGNTFYKSTKDTKRKNWQLWMNLSAHSYILTAQNINNEFLKYCYFMTYACQA